jgi:hypothetical protein
LLIADTFHTLFYQEPSEVAGLTALTVFFRGLSLVSVWILGEYLGRMLGKVGNDPQFIVRERLQPNAPAKGKVSRFVA